jgi:FkbM family methyltransferase
MVLGSLVLGPTPWRLRALRSFLRRVPRGRYRLMSSLGPRRGRFVGRLARDLGGAKFVCDMADSISREVCLSGMYEPPVTRIFQQHLSFGGTVVDAGANWGYFSLLSAPFVGPSGTVMAIEPDPRQFDALSRNVALNAFAQIAPLRVAVAAQQGQATLLGYGDDEDNRGVSRIADAGTAAQHFEVPCMTLDALTAAPSARQVDLVKIDVEGSEWDVLSGMRDGLASRRYAAIVLELHPALLRARRADASACVRLLQDHGYRGWTIDLSPAAYRKAMSPSLAPGALLLPLERWDESDWPHLLWLAP